MNYPDSVRFLYTLGNEIKTAKLGLDRIGTLLEALDNPHRACEYVHVAGTNGKGSTCAMIESGLRAAGKRTGLFISPHLVEPTERIQISGQQISETQFTSVFALVHETAEQLLASGLIDLHPTYFETVTAMAFLLFRDLQAELVVLEVGLGGRLDATNVIMPRLCVITPIDYDHEAYLGHSLQSIANEKAGILKPGVSAVFAPQRPEVEATLEATASRQGVSVIRTSQFSVERLVLERDGSSFDTGSLRLRCPLPGAHQVENALTAATALRTLRVSDEAIQLGISQTRWPGRLERISQRPPIILDGAHNPAGARALAAHIERFYRDCPVRLIYGAMRDKAVAEMAGILFPLAQEVILTAPQQARAVRPEAILTLASHPAMRVALDLREALDMAAHTGEPGVTFITGSLFLVGEARALLAK